LIFPFFHLPDNYIYPENHGQQWPKDVKAEQGE